jgi:hypothetical protein
MNMNLHLHRLDLPQLTISSESVCPKNGTEFKSHVHAVLDRVGCQASRMTLVNSTTSPDLGKAMWHRQSKRNLIGLRPVPRGKRLFLTHQKAMLLPCFCHPARLSNTKSSRIPGVIATTPFLHLAACGVHERRETPGNPA